MKFRAFYIKHQDIIELSKAYFGVILIVVLAIKFNWISTNLKGIFNTQTEMIIDNCMKSTFWGACP